MFQENWSVSLFSLLKSKAFALLFLYKNKVNRKNKNIIQMNEK